MKKLLLTVLTAAVLGLAALPALSNDQCTMCHQDQKENAVAGHTDCMACHSGGADEHMANIRTPPEPVTDETCATCHKPTEDFLAVSAHNMGMECSTCHSIHED